MDRINFQVPPGTLAPPSMNPPQQIFGAYGPDGLPQVPQLTPELAAQMFPDTHLVYDDSQDAKRRRIARACDMCRKKKIKCDGRLPSCTQCINYKTDCVFTQVEKKRAPPKGAKYIEGLENRLNRMENVLRLSGLLGEDEEDIDLGALEKRLEERDQGSSRRPSSIASASSLPPSQPPSVAADTSPRSSAISPGGPKPKKEKREGSTHSAAADNSDEGEDVEALSEMMCSLVTSQTGETRYLGSSSGFSIFSPKGIRWVNSKTGDESFQKTISEVSVDDHKWHNWKPEIFSDVFRRTVFRPLPPKDEALSLLKDYFENFNCIFPLFHQPTFMHLVHRQYSSDPYQGSGWWASLNCALAIAHRLRLMSNLVPPDEDDKAWGYLKNALGVFTELTMRNTDLLSVQGLLGMALFMQGTPNPQPATLLVAAAVRLAHTIGLHKRGTGFNLNPVEIEQRKRVFWIAYILDKELSLRAGRPPVQDDDDMNVELPDADPADNIGNIPLADGKGKTNIFRAICEIAVIESNVYKRLYSTKATKRSVGELLNTIGELDRQLEEWKDRIPIDFRPEHEIKASHTPLIIHVVMVHFAYYNCLTAVHRMSVHHGFWASRLSDFAIQGLNTRALNPRIYSSAALCTAAARASISLLKYIPQGDFSCVWMILYFPVSALMTLFANILNNPLDPKAKSDTRLINTVVTFLSMLGQEAEQGGVHRMLGVCAEFEHVAKSVIEKAEKEQSSRRKRKNVDSGKTPAKAERQNAPTSTRARGQSEASSASTATVPTSNGNRLSTPQTAGGGSSLHYSPGDASRSGESPALSASETGFLGTGFPLPQGLEGTPFEDFANLSTGKANGVDSSLQGQGQQQQQQPVLPSDLFSLPLTHDWAWAEITSGAYPTVENGNFEDPTSNLDGGQ